MSRRMLLVVRDFALDPYRAESRFQSSANCAGQFGDGKNLCGSLEQIGSELHFKATFGVSGERGLPACPRRQLADEIVFGTLPNTTGKLPALPRKINGHDARWPHSQDGCATFFSTGRHRAAVRRKGLPGCQ